MRQEAASSEVLAQTVSIYVFKCVRYEIEADRMQICVSWDSQQRSFLMRHLVDREGEPELFWRAEIPLRQLIPMSSLEVEPVLAGRSFCSPQINEG